MRTPAPHRAFAVGRDWQWGHLLFAWEDATLRVTRHRDIILEIAAVTGITMESEHDDDGGERGLLRVESPGAWRAFFVDRNQIQSNVREVDASLTTLTSVLEWLLPPGFVHRQGDIGVYACALPRDGEAGDPAASHPGVLAPLLGSRHLFDRPRHCAFIQTGGRYFVAVREPVRLIHPEHSPVEIAAGTYELVRARGRTLPGVATIAAAQTSTLPL